jgi:hypothetical protein
MQRVTEVKDWLTDQTARMGRIKLPTRKPRRGRYRATAVTS